MDKNKELMNRITEILQEEGGLEREAAFHLSAKLKSCIQNYIDACQSEMEQDVLTKVWIRKVLEREIKLAYAKKEGGVFFLLDIDEFKNINDTFGHPMGDKVLVAMAKGLRAMFRPSDAIARIGGDEFAVFVSKGLDSKVIRTKVEELSENLSSALSSALSTTAIVTVSIGVYESRTGDSFENYYRKADCAMYIAKRSGRGRYHIYQEGDLENQGTNFDVAKVKGLVEEPRTESGAYNVNFSGFMDIYRFLKRRLDRDRKPSALMLMTLETDKELAQYTQAFDQSVRETLRSGDVTSDCSVGQAAVILVGTDPERAENAAKRILARFRERTAYDNDVQIVYHCISIEGSDRE